jgi:hypothetical protein
VIILDDDHPVEFKMLTPGFNWLRLGAVLAHGLNGYHSPLPKGSTISTHTKHAGQMCFEGPELSIAASIILACPHRRGW